MVCSSSLLVENKSITVLYLCITLTQKYRSNNFIQSMILEVAILHVKKNQEIEFERDFVFAGKYISSTTGYIRHSLQKCVEQSNKYLLLVEWNKLEDHTVGFRESDAYKDWKRLLHHYYDPFPIVEHFEMIFTNP